MTNPLPARSSLPMANPLPMTLARRLALIIGVPAVLLVIGWTALTAIAWAGQGSFRVNLRVPVHSRTVTMAVEGQVSLRRGAAGLIRVTGTAHYALVRPSISWQSTSAGTSIRSRCRNLTGPCSFDYAVAIPGGVVASISDAAGDLTASGLSGRLTLAAESGAIRASALAGDVQISDQSGDITVAGLSGPDVIIKDESGNIGATGLTVQGVTVTDQSGDITLTFASVPRRVSVSCASGNIRLVLPRGPTAYRVDAHTSSGTTDTDVPTNSASAYVITATDQSGDISITR